MNAFNFPAPSGRYKVCINRPAPWRHYASCRLQISVGKDNFEGEKFQALCEWASNRFDNTTFIVSDTLQRHNIMFETGCDAAAAWKLSQAEGDRWLERNAGAIKSVKNAGVLRWDTLLNSPEYQPIVPSALLNAALDTTALEFWRRRSEGDPDKAFMAHSRAFLLEELAVFAFLFRDPAIDVYAGSWFKDLMAIQFPDKDYLSVDFTKNRAA